ncbi:imidazolonepropionase-like amidohydrolase [Bradyrhizobium sp. URHC0002]
MVSVYLRRLVSAAPVCALFLSTSAAQAQQTSGAVTLFNNVRVFDGKGTSLSEPTNVLVRGNLIETISRTPISVDRSATTTIVDGGGRTLMPGLIDNHWHAMLARTTPAQAFGDVGFNNLDAGAEATDTLMRGFTTIRDVGGPVFGLKRAIDEGIVKGPPHLSVRRHDHDHERARGFPPVDRSAANDRRHAHPHGAGRWRHSCG